MYKWRACANECHAHVVDAKCFIAVALAIYYDAIDVTILFVRIVHNPFIIGNGWWSNDS